MILLPENTGMVDDGSSEFDFSKRLACKLLTVHSNIFLVMIRMR